MSPFCRQVPVDAREFYKLQKSETFCVMAFPRFLVADWEICSAPRRSSASPCKEESKLSFGTFSYAMHVGLQVPLRNTGCFDSCNKHKAPARSQFPSHLRAQVIKRHENTIAFDFLHLLISIFFLTGWCKAQSWDPAFQFSTHSLTGRDNFFNILFLLRLFLLYFRWSPESEKGTFVSFSYLGGTFGSVITFPLCGKLTF